MSLANLEQIVRGMLNRFGVDLHRYRPEQSDMGRLSRMLSTHNINLVFDVGANVGQFAAALRRSGYSQKIISFEPLSTAHSKLTVESRHDQNWEIAPRVAIGDQEGEIIIHIAGNEVSSSALDMLQSHVAAAPDSAYIGSELVRVCPLDSIATRYLSGKSALFLKVDTQGYERQVLDGAPRSLQQAKGIQLELSLIPLYENQELFDTLVKRLTNAGFSIWSIEPGFCDPKLGRMLQVDVTFFRD